MPEIAEVRTVRDVLRKQILNKRIKEINILYPKMIESNVDDFKKILIDKKFINVDALGKWLIFDLDDYCLLSHLRMEGKFFIKEHNEKINKHEHVIFTFEDNTDLRYHDTRKFGRMNLIKKDDLYKVNSIAKLGPEPFDKELTVDYLLDKFKNKSLPIKSLLLDQTIINGLGNIYANEVLFASKIHPLKKGKELTEIDCENIIESSIKIVSEAIKLGGTTIKSYTSSLGVSGNYQDKLQVHRRENLPCFICRKLIKNIKINGRSTYYCDICQKTRG